MTPTTPGAAGDPTPPTQLTIGEVLFLERYEQGFITLRGRTPAHLELACALLVHEVCTTCGWSKFAHEQPGDDVTCAHFMNRVIDRMDH